MVSTADPIDQIEIEMNNKAKGTEPGAARNFQSLTAVKMDRKPASTEGMIATENWIWSMIRIFLALHNHWIILYLPLDW